MVQKRNAAAAGLLQLWSFLDNSDLWWEMLNLALECPKKRVALRALPTLPISAFETSLLSTKSHPNWLQNLAEDELSFLDAMRILLDLSIIRRNLDAQSYSVHPLVHSWVRGTVSSEHRHAYLNAAACVLGRCVPLAHHKDAWVLSRRLSPHIDQFWTIVDQEAEASFTSADGFDGIAIFEFDRSNFARAKFAWETACRCWGATSEPGNLLMLQCNHDCALSYRALGEFDAAKTKWEWVYRQCCQIEQDPMKHSPLLLEVKLRALDDLGRLYALQGKYDKSIELFHQALKGKKEALGDGDPLTLDTERQLALALYQQGKAAQAKELHEHVLAGFETACGPSNIWTLLAKSDLGAIYSSMGRREEATMMLEDAFESIQGQLGISNVKTKEVARNLISVLNAQGKIREANEIGAAISDPPVR